MSNQLETTSFDDLYKGVSHQIRTILVGTVSIIIGILTFYVFPLPRFGVEEDGNFTSILDSLSSSQVQLIILSNILGILLTYFYFSMVSEISQKGALILHNLVLVNIIIASIVIDMPYFSTFSLLIYLGVTILAIRLRPDNSRNDFISKSIIIMHGAILLIWYIKLAAGHVFTTFEPISTQLILLIGTVLYCRNEKRRLLLILPLLLNVILLPVLMINDYSKYSEFLFREDISLLLFGIILLINVIIALIYRESNYSKYLVISSSMLLFAEHVLIAIFSGTFFEIHHFDILGITVTQMSIWYLILVASILFIWFTSDHSFTNIVAASILFVTIMFTLTFDINHGISRIPQLFLAVSLFSTSVILFLRFRENELFIPILQVIGIYLLSTIPERAFSDFLQTLSLIGFVIVSVLTWFRYRKIEKFYVYTIASLGGLVILYILSWNFDFFNPVHYLLMVFIAISIGVFTLFVNNNKQVIIGIIIQAISLFFISMLERDKIISGLDWLDLGLILFIVELILLSLKYKSDTYVMKFNVMIPVLFFISIVLRSYLGNYSLPNEIVLGVLIILPTVQLYISNIEDTIRNYTVVLQGVGIAFFTSINQYVGLIKLISFLYLAFILLSIIVWYIKKFENLFVVFLAVTSSLLQLFFVIRSSDKFNVPGIIEMGLAILLISTLLKWIKDDEYSRWIVLSQSIAVIILGFFRDQVMISNYNLLTASSSIISFSHISHIPWVSLILITFGIIVGLYWIRSNSKEYNFTPLILMGLFSILNLGSIISGYNSTPPFFLALMILFVSSILIKREDKYHLHVVVLAALNILLMLLNAHQIRILVNSLNLGIISIVYLIFSVMLINQWRNKDEDKAFPIIMVVAALTLVLSIISKTLSYSVPMEFLVIVSLSLSLISLNSENTRYKKYTVAIQSIIVAIILLRENLFKVLISLGDGFHEYLATSTVLFLGFILLALFVLKNADNFYDWVLIMGSYLLVILVSSLRIYTVHPIIIGISIILLSYLSYSNSFHYVKELVPVAQGFGIILLLANEIRIGDVRAIYTSIFFVVFTVATLVVWYLKGKDKQLMYSYMSIFVLGMLLSLFSINRDFLLIHEFYLLFSLIFATGFLIAFYSRLRTLDPNWLIGILVVTSVTLAVVSRSFQSHFLGNYSIYLRLALDWLIFVPLMVETAIYIKRYIETTLRSEDNAGTGDSLVILLQLILTITALLMGSTGILSMKLLAIALVFWMFATVFVRKYLAWGTSINTAFTLAFMLAQIGSPESTNEIFYFIALTIIGFLMIGAALINEKKFVGEPLTSSMLMTGSIFSVFTIFAPLLRNNSFPSYVIDKATGDQIINFLPNIVWAIQGLGIFVIAMRMEKENWRKMALSILLLDIVKTAIDIFSQTNDFIRIIGSIVLGVVLIFIFLQFTKEEETNVEIIHEETEE